MRQHWNWKALIIGQKKKFKRKVGSNSKLQLKDKDTTGEASRCDMKSVKNKKPGLQVRIILHLLLSRTFFYQTQTFNRKCLV